MYSIELKQESIMLLSSTHRAEIYRYGGLLNRFEINKIDGSWWNVVDAQREIKPLRMSDAIGRI